MTRNKITWTGVKKLLRKYGDFSNPLIRKFKAKEHICIEEWSGSRLPKHVKSDQTFMRDIGLSVHIVKGNKCDKPMHVLRGHSTMAMYVRPKDLKDQLVLGYILDRVGFYEE